MAEDPFVTPPRPVDPRSSSEGLEPFPAFDASSSPPFFTPRADRLGEAITADNAQAVLDPHACVFVANLSNFRSDEELQQSCERKFGQWGKCYPKIRRDKKGMPYALIQYHQVEHARIAIRDSKGMVMDGRQIRTEHARADRAVLLTRHTGGAISDVEARGVLEQFGAIEETCPIAIADQKARDLPEGRWVKFAFFQDCVDARYAFRHHEFYKLVSDRKDDSRTPRDRSHDPNTTPPSSAHRDRNPYRAARNTPDDQSLFLGDLPVDVTERQIRQVFGRYGQVVFVDIHRKQIRDTSQENIFAFLGYDTPQAADDALNAYPDIRGFPIRIERKAWGNRRNLRMHNEPTTPSYEHNPILLHLYHAGLQLGLPQDMAKQILSIRPRHQHRTSIANDHQAYNNQPYGIPPQGIPPQDIPPHGTQAYSDPGYGPQAYGNPAYAPPAYGNPAYGPQAYGNLAYGPQAYGNPAGPQTYGNPALGASATDESSYLSSCATHTSSYYRPQLAQPSNVEYRPLQTPQKRELYDPYATTEPTSSAPSQHVAGGTTYYSHPDQSNRATTQAESGTQLELIYGRGHSHHYDHQSSSQPIDQAPETTDPEHRFSHESYLPETYAGEPYNPHSYARGYTTHRNRRFH